MNTFDYIIIGGGSAGCALARKLSDLNAGNTLLLEAGGTSERSAIQNPTEWATLWNTDVDYAYKTVPQAGTAGRIHDWPRGRVLGGTSCLNAMQFIRGHRSDFDSWAGQGNPGWNYDSVLPYFKDIEDFEGGASKEHGSGGPVHVSVLHDKNPNPISEAFVQAAAEVGYPLNSDINGPELEGAGWNPTSIKDGVRQHADRAFLAPVAGRTNLTVRTNAPVARLVFRDNACVGVELMDGEMLHAEREVILSAGAIDSPRILLQSGVGPAADLTALGIEVVADVPGVGKNLQDHLLLGVVYEASKPIPEGKNNLSESVLFTRSSQDRDWPDIQVAAIHVPFHSPEFRAPANSYTIAPGIVRPLSRGSLRLTAAKPGSPLDIDPNYLAEEADIEGLLRGIEMSRELGSAAAFDEWRGQEILPGPEVRSEADLRAFVARAASTYYHPAGTCKMGVDTESVVDHTLRVRGIEGLRVADASIMPTIVSVNPNFSIMMIGYKAGDMIAAAHNVGQTNVKEAPIASGQLQAI